MLLTAADLPDILVQRGEHPGVVRATGDLADDLERILGRRPALGTWDGSATRGLIIGTNAGRTLDGWQASEVRLDGERVWFTGSDRCRWNGQWCARPALGMAALRRRAPHRLS